MSAMSSLSGGVLEARVRFDGARIESVDLRLQRPLQVLAGLRGRRLEECLQLLPLLFPLCGKAHALAVLQAAESALAITPVSGNVAARELLAIADALAAHAWRTCIDWAQLSGSTVDAQPVARARRLVQGVADALYPDGDWLRIGGGRLAPDHAALVGVRAELAALCAELDPLAALATLRLRLPVALAGAEREWTPRLDSCFAARADAVVAAMATLAARLEGAMALAEMPAALAIDGAATGHGSGSVDTARGQLCYELAIDAGRVAACSLVAPTDRLFADHGPVAQSLARLQRAEQPLAAVRWVLAAFDPCVEVRVVTA